MKCIYDHGENAGSLERRMENLSDCAPGRESLARMLCTLVEKALDTKSLTVWELYEAGIIGKGEEVRDV